MRGVAWALSELLMKYKRFVIKNYRAIVGPIEIDVHKSSLMPIIGINESGKTTILHAIFAFDFINDTLNEGGRHLEDTANLYQTASPPSEIQAEVDLSKSELKNSIAKAWNKDGQLKNELGRIWRKRELPDHITITRNLKTRNYSIAPSLSATLASQDAIARQVISNLPYILYFDDFRDKIPERIEILDSEKDSTSGWLPIIERLFQETDPSYSVFNLPTMEERLRKSVLSRVERKLNETLTREWQNFKLDERDALRISVDFQPTQGEPAQQQGGGTVQPKPASIRNYIKLDVVEKDKLGFDHFFFVSDRSKGFYWFFNFVMKLEFNPKLVHNQGSAIYLLDEPGSYLHSFAQRKLCQKIRGISERNWVAYCTHSHYLLDPEVIPVNKVMVADKDSDGAISLIPLTEYRSPKSEKRSALQPVLDALQIKPIALDLISDRTTIIAEGIYDYFALTLFSEGTGVSVLPSVGAESIKFFISLMIAWQVDFRALWDNDAEGQRRFAEASEYFDSEISRNNLRLLPATKRGGKRIMQDLFDGGDLKRIRSELGLAGNCSFERTLHALFYSSRRTELVSGMSEATVKNFSDLFEALSLRRGEAQRPGARAG
jgi:ABC-type cobalamin/Fe3+-siderophores transport system ATPase subunit